MFREKIRINFSQLTDVAIIAFLISMTYSITTPVFPIFAERIYGKPEGVGLIVSVFGASAIFLNIYIMRFFERWGILRNLKIGLLLFSFVFASYVFIDSVKLLALSQVVLAAAVCLCSTALSLLVNNNSKRKNIGDSEGEYFTSMNLGILIGIINGGIIAKSYSHTAVFSYASLIFIGLYFLAGTIGIRDNYRPRKSNLSFFEDAGRFFSNTKLRKTYLSNFGIFFWISLSFLYLPIILKSQGFNFGDIGFVLALMMVPYIMLEYPAGRIAQKEGSSKLISIGFFTIALTSFFIYVNYGALYSMVFFFFLSFMGAAAIEPLNEIDLDKASRKSNIVENMSIFKSSLRISQFLGPISAAAMISLFGMREMFLIISGIMLIIWFMIRK